MINRMLSSALFAGFAVGLLAALLQYAFVEKLILRAEQYESGELVHFQNVAAMARQDAAMAAAADTATTDSTGAATMAETIGSDADGHDNHAPTEASSLLRQGLSVLFAALIYTGYALVLAAGYGVSWMFGQVVTVQKGLLWGLAGFAAFQLAPAMGLEPELPGATAASLDARQLWWVGTAIATAAGLGLLAFGRGGVPWIAGLALLAMPHVIGAPELASYSGTAPPELAASFAARSLGVGLVTWVALGGVLAWFTGESRG